MYELVDAIRVCSGIHEVRVSMVLKVSLPQRVLLLPGVQFPIEN